MKWMTVRVNDAEYVGYQKGSQLQPVNARSMRDIIEGGSWSDAGEPVPLESLGAMPPLMPRSIICIGANYRDHCLETGLPIPDRPVVFAKLPNTIAADGDPLQWPRGVTEEVDWEAELGVVIGRRAKGIHRDQALEHVFGYVAVNDVTARDLQLSDGQWIRGKSLDGFCPLAPTLVTRDEIPDVQALGIRCLVNGKAMQSSNTGEMIFDVRYLIEFLSKSITLEPGDLILTGTPAGVGMGYKPPHYLQRGDVVSVEIDGVGTVTNVVEGAFEYI